MSDEPRIVGYGIAGIGTWRGPEHTLGWQVGGLASVETCHGESIGARDLILNTDRDARQCPKCKKWLRLVWDVRVEEVTTGDTTDHE